MEPNLPIENPNLPADKQDAGNEPLPVGEVPTMEFGKGDLPKHSPPPIPGVKLTHPGKSPTQKQTSTKEGDFAFAVSLMAKGQRVTKRDWNNKDWYGELRDAKLMIHSPDGVWHDWVIQEGDLIGKNWIAV